MARWALGFVGCLLGGAMMVPLGPTSTGRAVDSMNSTSTRGVPSVGTPPPPGSSEPMIWVPDRVAPLPGAGNVMVPGHWERRLPGTSEVFVPSLTTRDPATGATTTTPAGTRPPVNERHDSP